MGAGGEAGVAELRRIVRPGGAIVVIDNDLRDGTFADWLGRLEHQRDPEVVDGWWAEHGFDAQTVRSDWSFDSRADLEAVVRLELPSIAEAVLADHEGTVVDYGFRLFSCRV